MPTAYAIADKIAGLTPEQKVRLQIALANRPLLAKEVIRIIPKGTGGTLVPLEYNYLQNKLHETLLLFPWLVVVKGRQGGCTTGTTLGEFFLDLIINPPQRMAVVSHEREATQRILEMVHVAYDNLPEWLKPPIQHDSVSEMSFPSINSAIYIGTAGSRKFGRGDTFHKVLLTEFSKWDNSQCKSIRSGIQESSPVNVIIESTPDGEGNEHHMLYQEAKAGLSPYRALFFPWFITKEYTFAVNHPLVRTQDAISPLEYTPDEKVVVEKYHLTEGQIRWRRTKIAGFPGSPKEKMALFLQEYPEDDVSCFMTIALGVFNIERIGVLRAGSRPPQRIDEWGTLWWADPLPSRVYVVGVDTATGWGEDDASAVAIDFTDYPKVRQIARLSGKYGDDVFARKIAELGRRLNNAYLVVEENNTGYSVLNSLINQIHYPMIYYRKDPFTGQALRPGWHTSAPSKQVLVTGGVSIVEGGYFLSEDADLVQQMSTFKSYPGGGIGASPGCHDDHVMAFLLAIQGASELPRTPVGGSVEKSHPYGWSW